jgi:hypothetical protein
MWIAGGMEIIRPGFQSSFSGSTAITAPATDYAVEVLVLHVNCCSLEREILAYGVVFLRPQRALDFLFSSLSGHNFK